MAETPKPAQALGGEVGSSSAGLTPDILERLARLDQAEKEIEQLRQEKEALEAAQAAGMGRMRVRHEAAPFAPPGGSYKFRITPSAKDLEKYPHLKPSEQMACDESEMIRWYCATNEDKEGSGKQIDPMHLHLKVECVDKRRAQHTVLKQRLAALRVKVSSGSALSADDQALLKEYEAEVFQYPKGAS